jgi:hypothetical protein
MVAVVANNSFKGSTSKDNFIHWKFLSKAYDLRLICIKVGWPKGSQTAEEIRNIKNATIDLGNKNCSDYNKTFHSDAYKFQQVNVSCKTHNVYLYLNSTYRAAKKHFCVPPPPDTGTTGCTALTGISEVRFYYSPGVLSHIPWNPSTSQPP